MRYDRPLTTLQGVFPAELQESRAVHEVVLDDRSKLLFIPLQMGGMAIQTWCPGMAKDGHGYLLAGSAILSPGQLAALIAKLQGC